MVLWWRIYGTIVVRLWSGGPTDPGLHHVGLPVELQEGRVLVQLGLPLGRCPLQLRHLAPQGGHLGTDVVNMMVVLGNTHTHTHATVLSLKTLLLIVNTA